MSGDSGRYAEGERPDAASQFSPRRTDHARELRRAFSLELRQVISSLPGGDDALDFGCAARPFEELLLSRYNRYIGADLPGNPRADVAVARDGRVPIENSSIDCVLSTQVVEHVPDVDRYLGEVRRVLRPGGHLVLSTNGHYRYHPDPSDYWRWTPDGLRAQLIASGFEPGPIISVLSGPSAALQLWQSTTVDCLPTRLRPMYIVALQSLIRLVERLSTRRFDPDAVAFIVVATPNRESTPGDA